MGALGIPSAADIERLTRRLRSVSQRLEGIEDGIDRLDERVGSLGAATGDDRLARVEAQLDAMTRELAELRAAVGGREPAVPREQERLRVGEQPS